MKEAENNIPTGWKKISFGSLFDFIPTIALSREQLTSSSEKNEPVYNIHYGDIHAAYEFDILDLSKEKNVPIIIEDIDTSKAVFLKDGDLIIADASEDYEGVAESVELVNVGKKKVTGGLHTFVARSKTAEIALGIKTYLLKNILVKEEIKKIATGSKVYGVSKTNLLGVDLYLPPFPEQTKIVKILSTCDDAIDKLSKLIIAKEKHKKGLMQSLLTGRVRFKEYKDKEWVKDTLKSICKLIKDGSHGTHLEVEGGIPLLSAKDIQNGEILIPSDCRKLSKKDYDIIHKNYKIEIGDLILTLVGTIGRCALVKNVDTLFTFQRSVGIIKLKDNYDPNYFYQLFSSEHFTEQLISKANASAQAGVYLGELEKVVVYFPKSIDEQHKIAEILNQADLEIENLKLQLKKLKHQKAGLMQQLLTGKIRTQN